MSQKTSERGDSSRAQRRHSWRSAASKRPRLAIWVSVSRAEMRSRSRLRCSSWRRVSVSSRFFRSISSAWASSLRLTETRPSRSWRERSEKTRRSAISAPGLADRRSRKTASGISSTSVSSRARRVAARSRRSMRAISPKQSPGRPTATCLPALETTTLPARTTYIAWPSSPSWHSAWPGASTRSGHAPTRASSSGSDSGASSPVRRRRASLSERSTVRLRPPPAARARPCP